MDTNNFSCLRVAVEDRIATVTLQAVGAANVAGVSLLGELDTLWQRITVDESIAAVILTSEGKTFSAGGDIKHMAARAGTPEGLRHALRVPGNTRRLWQNMLAVEQPIVAAINGDALGFGASLALFCDITVMAAEARIGDSHVKVGLVAGDGGAVIWPLLIGVARAKDFLMRGRVINGKEAQQIGLVTHSEPGERVLAKAREIAAELVALPAWAVRWTKLAVNKHLQQSLNLTLDTSIAYEAVTMQTVDFGEGTRAFLEKRKPTFKGE